MANFIKTGCSDCCPCASHCVCEEIGFRVGFALYPPSHPQGGTPMQDPDASLCCRALRPSVWWAAPPASITSQLLPGESLEYEVWASDANAEPASCLRCGGDGSPAILNDACTLHHLVISVAGPEATGQSGGGGALPTLPPITRAEWYGGEDEDGCCKRWPNFFLKVRAVGPGGPRVLAICNATWGGDQGEELCDAPISGGAPCKCGIFEECPDCPENDGIASLSISINVNGSSIAGGAMTRAGVFTDGCDCPGSSWVKNMGICGINHTALLCLGQGGGYSLNIFQQSFPGDPDTEFSMFSVAGGCGNPSIPGPVAYSAGLLCGFEFGVDEVTVNFSVVPL